MQIHFKIRELMLEKERVTQKPVSFRGITREIGISSNTLSILSHGKAKMVGLSTIERLLDYFNCQVSDLIVYEDSVTCEDDDDQDED